MQLSKCSSVSAGALASYPSVMGGGASILTRKNLGKGKERIEITLA